MGGEVTVSSVPGESSTFTIIVPAHVTEPEHAEHVEAVATKLNNSGTLAEFQVGESVLVVDDDVNQRELMSRFLQREGFSVQTARDGEEGLRMAKSFLPFARFVLDGAAH